MLSWPLAFSLAPKVLAGLKFLLLTRLLGPAEFGKFALALIWIGITEGLSDFGFRQAIVQQSSDPDPEQAAALNTLLLVRGAGLAVLMLLVAEVLTRFTSGIDIPSIFWICAIPLSRGLYVVSYSVALRHLDYRRLFFFECTWRTFDLFVTGVVLYVFARNSRAAVATTAIAEYFAVVVAGWMVANRLIFSRQVSSATSVARYGRWIWGQSILTVLLNQLDKVYVASAFGTAAMGAYQGMSRLMQLIIADPVTMLMATWFPKLASDIRKNELAAWRRFRAILLGFVTVMSVVVTATIIFRTAIVRLAFGDRWVAYSNYLPLFAASMTIGGLITSLVTWFRCTGMPERVTLSTMVQVICYVAGVLLIGALRGPFGVALAVMFAALASLLVLLVSLGWSRLKHE